MTEPPGPLIASGRSADVYDIGDGRVLRRYRSDGHDVEYEARVMAHVAERGYPVPEVFDVGGRDLVMERVEGTTMLDALSASPFKLVWHARLLARLQRQLARIAAPEWMLASTADPNRAESILHLDLHPMNVMLSKRSGPVVIDWANAAGGPAGFDAGLTYVKIATFSATDRTERFGQLAFSRSFKWFRRAPHFDAYLRAACDHWLADPGITPEERVAVAELRSSLT